MSVTASAPPPPRAIAAKLGAGSAAAAAILVLFVLPAEAGIDLTGAGRAMGLTALSAPGKMTELQRGALREGQIVSLSNAAVKQDHWEVELAPFKSIEFKYTMAKGSAMLFAWQASGDLHYDMHSHPFDGGTDLTESYAVGDAREMQGSYVAPFAGIHGWYWQNQSPDTVTLTLDATGGFTSSTIFDNLGEYDRPLAKAE